MDLDRRKGEIKWFNKRGYGFLLSAREDFYFHIKDFIDTPVIEEKLLQGTVLYFSVGENLKGTCAVRLSFRG